MTQKETDSHKKHQQSDEELLDQLGISDLTPLPPRDEDGIDESFEALLEEFLEEQANEDSRNIKMGEIELIVDCSPTREKEFSQRTQFSIDEGKYLFASIACMGCNHSGITNRWDETFSVELLSPEGKTFAQLEITLSLSTEEESRLTAYFDLSSRSSLEGDWRIRITPQSAPDESQHKTFTYYPYPQNRKKKNACTSMNMNYMSRPRPDWHGTTKQEPLQSSTTMRTTRSTPSKKLSISPHTNRATIR